MGTRPLVWQFDGVASETALSLLHLDSNQEGGSSPVGKITLQTRSMMAEPIRGVGIGLAPMGKLAESGLGSFTDFIVEQSLSYIAAFLFLICFDASNNFAYFSDTPTCKSCINLSMTKTCKGDRNI